MTRFTRSASAAKSPRRGSSGTKRIDSLDSSQHVGNLTPVKWLKSTVTVFLLALWLPATSHGLLQQAGWIHAEHADEAGAPDTDNDHDAADGICVVSTDAQLAATELCGLAPAFSSLGFAFVLAALAESLPASSGPDPPGTAPPQLSHRWQFSFRTALPARAPSLIS